MTIRHADHRFGGRPTSCGRLLSPHQRLPIIPLISAPWGGAPAAVLAASVQGDGTFTNPSSTSTKAEKRGVLPWIFRLVKGNGCKNSNTTIANRRRTVLEKRARAISCGSLFKLIDLGCKYFARLAYFTFVARGGGGFVQSGLLGTHTQFPCGFDVLEAVPRAFFKAREGNPSRTQATGPFLRATLT
jgi:hypothetical protein